MTSEITSLGAPLETPMLQACGFDTVKEDATLRDDLTPLFDISEDHGEGSKPNAVDAAEFESALSIYSAIVQGVGCLDMSQLNPDTRTAALKDFKEILRTKTGRHLLRDVLEDPEGDKIIMEQLKAGWSPNTKSLDMSKSLRLEPDQQPPGADSLMGYHPGDAHEFRGEGEAPDWYPITSDVVLFHELLHAEHHQSGTAIHNTEGRHNRDEENLTTGTDPNSEAYMNENRYREERRELGEDAANRDWYFKP